MTSHKDFFRNVPDHDLDGFLMITMDPCSGQFKISDISDSDNSDATIFNCLR